MKPFLRLLRPLNCLMASVAVLIGAYLGGISASFASVLFAMLAAFMVSGGGMVINDYYDRELDFIYDHDRPIPSGKVSLRTALIFSFVLFIFGIYLSFWVNKYTLAVASLNSILLVAYAKDLQKRFLVSNLTISFLVGSTFVFGGLAVKNFFPSLFLALMAFFANTAREIIKDLEDKEADTVKEIRSVPIVLGKDKARLMSSIFVLVGVCLSPLPIAFGVFGLWYGLAVVFSIGVFLRSVYMIHKGAEPSQIQGMLKLGMILGLVAFLVGAL
ncbi:MAG: UbiA family prenyltransferase [Candidatus Aenigmatarchaeota archaeon]